MTRLAIVRHAGEKALGAGAEVGVAIPHQPRDTLATGCTMFGIPTVLSFGYLALHQKHQAGESK
jgi:hypothetical protein